MKCVHPILADDVFLDVYSDYLDRNFVGIVL